MNYSIVQGLLKGLKSAVVATLAVLAASGGIDIFFNTFTSSLGGLQLPVYVLPLVIGAFSMLRNWLKQYLSDHVVAQKVL